MNTEELKNTLKDYARDIRLNFSTVLTEEGSPGLELQRIWGVALACSYFTKNQALIQTLEKEGEKILTNEFIDAARGAASIMAMNNIYYRFTHLVEEREFTKMPVKLRMNIIGKPGIDKVDFELMCLAVSSLAGCGACINSHIHEVQKAGLSHEAIQSSIRIAAVINAMAQALSIQQCSDFREREIK
ncbi:MAG: carboxymuconolactone decarboxylase family protein [Bdellovibrionales bacterium]|nr:carboxymuconolactone decarboxylase family protein [Bdellovibrionales bacterium]